jgi:hypothetical protein
VDDPSEAPRPGVDTFRNVVRDFLLAERRLLEKEREGEPTTGDRPPTAARFALLDSLLQEYGRGPTGRQEFEAVLCDLADGSSQRLPNVSAAEQQNQAAQMLARWRDFQLLGQPTAQRTPYEPSE